MASVAARSIRALRGSTKPTSLVAAGKRRFSASAHDDAYETEKWEKITYAGIATCTILAIYNLSKGHPHHEPPPRIGEIGVFLLSLDRLFLQPYPYLHIRNKEFPWGPDGLFETKHHDEH